MTGNARRVVVLGLDCAAPQLVFDQFAGNLEHLPRLMAEGVWGELQSVVPAITVPAWACSMTSRESPCCRFRPRAALRASMWIM